MDTLPFTTEEYADEATRRIFESHEMLVKMQERHPDLMHEIGEVVETLLPEHDVYFSVAERYEDYIPPKQDPAVTRWSVRVFMLLFERRHSLAWIDERVKVAVQARDDAIKKANGLNVAYHQGIASGLSEVRKQIEREME